ncbi:MAG: ATP-binding protein [Gammaproteobacteria bacterium]|nr:ATP-binding protein [Gammaproteobacteria bacterium]
MKNIVGQVPRGKDFFPRDKIIDLIYRRLDTGANLYLAAPRRTGKTAIMRRLQDSPRDHYAFTYVTTESVDNAENYCKRLLTALHQSDGLPRKTLQAINDFLGNIKKMKLAGVDLEFAEKENTFEKLEKLLRELDTDGMKAVIMVDEFPQTVENILRKDGAGAAEKFLQINRALRQQSNNNVLFILTGSIGLPGLAEKLNATKEINDLNIVKAAPLNREEAKALLTKLLDSASVPYESEALEYLLDKAGWFVPFHIQLLVQELIDRHAESEEGVNKTGVDKVFANVAGTRHDTYFEHYYSRLQTTFDAREHPFALALLNRLCREESLDAAKIEILAAAHELDRHKPVLRALEFDGYIFNDEGKAYRFTSPILRLWWQHYVS